MPNTLYVACGFQIASKICICPCGCFEEVPLTRACAAGQTTQYTVETTSNSVLLSTGSFVFKQELLRIDAIGTGSFNFGLNYNASQLGSRALGPGFQFAQNVRISRFDDGDVILDSGNFTTETFTYDSDTGTYSSVNNNTAAELRVENLGTPIEEYLLSASDGRVTRFFGFHASIATPGQIKTFADRYGNTMTFAWQATDGVFQLTEVTDSYGRTVHYRYYGSDKFYRLRELQDFLGRTITFQYDNEGRLVAVMTPVITKAAKGNEKPNGTAFVFQYDTGNPREARRNDLIRIWYPNQATSFIRRDEDGNRYVDIKAVQQQTTPRYSVEYGQDPNQYNTWGKVLRETIGDPNPANGVGGTVLYQYITNASELPPSIFFDPDPPETPQSRDTITSRTTVTDRNGNITHYDFNPDGMVIRKEVVANRRKVNMVEQSYVTWTRYNEHNQELVVIEPEGNSTIHEYDDGMIPGFTEPYAKRIGLLRRTTRKSPNLNAYAERFVQTVKQECLDRLILTSQSQLE